MIEVRTCVLRVAARPASSPSSSARARVARAFLHSPLASATCVSSPECSESGLGCLVCRVHNARRVGGPDTQSGVGSCRVLNAQNLALTVLCVGSTMLAKSGVGSSEDPKCSRASGPVGSSMLKIWPWLSQRGRGWRAPSCTHPSRLLPA